jgi:hypothetical protein
VPEPLQPHPFGCAMGCRSAALSRGERFPKSFGSVPESGRRRPSHGNGPLGLAISRREGRRPRLRPGAPVVPEGHRRRRHKGHVRPSSALCERPWRRPKITARRACGSKRPSTRAKQRPCTKHIEELLEKTRHSDSRVIRLTQRRCQLFDRFPVSQTNYPYHLRELKWRKNRYHVLHERTR